MTDEEYKQGVLALKFVAKTSEGQRALRFFVESCNLFDDNMTDDARKDAFFNGKRSMALYLRDLLGHEEFMSILATKLA